ncbi:MAG: cation:dicarboxylase symporter family transporter, partial [Deltaproteobacteria bacterium]|nr:cation:dicarboxylase symporter family transporter [Deltaproteobacteria bacterium]
MATETKKRFRLGLSGSILLGFVLGILCGLFFGEYCAWLKIFGDAFIKLLQMSILPYIVISLIVGIGRLSYQEAKVLAIKAGSLLLVFWGIALAVIFLMPLAFPSVETASFFSTTLVKAKEQVDFLELFIPSNPFSSLANDVIPASVLFSIAVGIGLIGIKEKHKLIDDLAILATALSRVANFVVYLTPIGVFAIAASAAGTMTLEEIGRLQVYFVTFIVAAMILTFWILPMLVASLTPFTYKDVVGTSKDALVTGFATGKLFIILPILIQNCNDLFERYKQEHKDTASFVDIIVPVSFNFPTTGKLLTLLFILFCAWFTGNAVSVTAYPYLSFIGVSSLFASTDMAIPFLLDSMQIPSDLYQLFILTGIVNRRFATLLAGMNLLTFTLLATCAITGLLSINWKKLFRFALLSVMLTVGVVGGTRFVLSFSATDAYSKDKVLAGMHLLQNPAEVVVHKSAPSDFGVVDKERSHLKRILERGVLRVGYNPDRLPFTFFNNAGELLGFDVEMAHRLAKELGVSLEFIPFEVDTMAKQLNGDHFDIIMAGVPMFTPRLETMSFSDPYLDVTFALVVKDNRREEFATAEKLMGTRGRGLTFGVRGGYEYYFKRAKESLPLAKVVQLESYRDFFEDNTGKVDALVISAEVGAAWTLLYPEYQVVV